MVPDILQEKINDEWSQYFTSQIFIGNSEGSEGRLEKKVTKQKQIYHE
jgi:hypothetical protein